MIKIESLCGGEILFAQGIHPEAEFKVACLRYINEFEGWDEAASMLYNINIAPIKIQYGLARKQLQNYTLDYVWELIRVVNHGHGVFPLTVLPANNGSGAYMTWSEAELDKRIKDYVS